MYNRLMDFIEKHQLLYQYQFRFGKNHSTFVALVILLCNITAALNYSEYAVCIKIYLRKAVDTVEHNILLKKLSHCGIRRTTRKLSTSYLIDRYQYVNYNNAISDMKQITCGVPQGSILDSLLFYYTYMILPQYPIIFSHF